MDTLRYRGIDSGNADPEDVKELVDGEGFHYPIQANQTVVIPDVGAVEVPGTAEFDSSNSEARN